MTATTKTTKTTKTAAATKPAMTKDERAAARAAKAAPAPKKVNANLAAAAAMFKSPEPVADTPVATKPKKERAARTESASETVREIVRLASRPEGATKAELEAASGWKNAGWPWMFFNPKTGRGIAPRHGMKLVIKDRPAEEGKRALKAYCLVKG